MILLAIASDLERTLLTTTLPDTVTTLVCGVGKVASAVQTATELQRIRPELVLSLGVAGYYGSELAVGDIALVVREHLVDEGVATDQSFINMGELGLMETTFVSSLPGTPFCRPELGFRQKVVPGATVSSVTGTQLLADQRYGSFGPPGVCESMEGAAIAYACRHFGVHWLGVRGISNFVEERDTKRWNIPLAMANLSTYLAAFLEEYTYS